MSQVTDPRAMGILASVRWWAGWHPVTTVVAGGGLLGFLLANALVTWWLRWLGTVQGAGNVVQSALLPIAGFLVLGLAVGAWGWVVGVREVNDRFRRGPSAFVDRHRSPVDPSFVLVGADDDRPDGTDAGARPLLVAPERVPGQALSFGPEDVAIRSVTVDVADRRVYLGEGERIVPYDRIATVDVDGDAISLETDDGETLRLGAERSGDVDAVTGALRERVAS